jgi:hypothetical protein
MINKVLPTSVGINLKTTKFCIHCSFYILFLITIVMWNVINYLL